MAILMLRQAMKNVGDSNFNLGTELGWMAKDTFLPLYPLKQTQ